MKFFLLTFTKDNNNGIVREWSSNRWYEYEYIYENLVNHNNMSRLACCCYFILHLNENWKKIRRKGVKVSLLFICSKMQTIGGRAVIDLGKKEAN